MAFWLAMPAALDGKLECWAPSGRRDEAEREGAVQCLRNSGARAGLHPTAQVAVNFILKRETNMGDAPDEKEMVLP